MAAHADLDSLLSTPIDEQINKDTVHSILTHGPFVNIQGTFNVRDLCGAESSVVRPYYAFRSGTLERLGEGSFNTLHNLGIKTIFDLRSLKEKTASPDPEIPGIEIVWQPSTTDNGVQPQTFQAQASENVLLHSMYSSLLESHQPSFQAVLRHILEHPDKPFLFHCTAGKDRTGVLAAIIMSLADASVEDIQRDYALSRVGIEPVRAFLLDKVTASGKVDLNDPRVKAAGGFPSDATEKLFESIQAKYGGIDAYISQQLGFSEDEIVQIRRNLRQE